jgi:hypothetical protein
MIKQTTVIVYPGGCYGTYLEWCLSTLTNSKHIQSPFNANGNSHNFHGHQLFDIQGWRRYCDGQQNYKFVRLHPKTEASYSIKHIIFEIASQAHKVIYLYPTKSTLLLSLNNYFNKIWDNWFSQVLSATVDINKLYTNWPVAADTPIEQINPWILREFCSFYLMPMWLDQIGWHDLPWQHPNVMTVTIEKLLREFSASLADIQNFCELDFERPISTLLPYHDQNLQLQKYLNHDKLCNSAVEATLEGKNFDWQPLGLCSESWVQWQLRNQGYEIQCNGLDTFPTNSLQLKKLLYPV